MPLCLCTNCAVLSSRTARRLFPTPVVALCRFGQFWVLRVVALCPSLATDGVATRNTPAPSWHLVARVQRLEGMGWKAGYHRSSPAGCGSGMVPWHGQGPTVQGSRQRAEGRRVPSPFALRRGETMVRTVLDGATLAKAACLAVPHGFYFMQCRSRWRRAAGGVRTIVFNQLISSTM